MSKTDHNQHLKNALLNITRDGEISEHEWGARTEHIIVDSNTVSFAVQSGPVKEFGRNGCDATDIIRYAIGLYRSFNSAHPCRENSITLTKLEEALHWQEARTRDRINRGVESSMQD